MFEIQESLNRLWEHLLARPSGPLAFRFLIQPAMAAIFAIHDGLRDARTGRSPYFWTVLTVPDQRRARLREGFRATGKVMVLALILDSVYQLMELESFYPGEAILIAVLLAFAPYLVIRGPAARAARRWQSRSSSGQTT